MSLNGFAMKPLKITVVGTSQDGRHDQQYNKINGHITLQMIWATVKSRFSTLTVIQCIQGHYFGCIVNTKQ